ncbi:hypothetical protein QLS71_015830 [Mariniflexile litorale]|uniref:Auto-transporter adhesin head GIN domain-containing protein n=1 Tax=Mariniflexile litorale TaxID=3045158 RepID=A0AAU7EEB8_9FLAO|nr:hypothetical protein [Mariniflexile sp. KMM 9835]MDQ8212385.1 hypothetical protein [Mariniflexile sp. KMM 9835]
MINKLPFTLNAFICVICISLLSFNEVVAQETKVFELKNGTLLQNSNLNGADEVPNQLLYSLKPSIYVKNNNIIKVTGPQKPISLTLYDANSLNILKTENSLFSTVQILKVQLKEISDLNSYIDFSNISGFNNLSYIYVTTYFKCTESQIRAFIKNIDSEITIYFENVNPS